MHDKCPVARVDRLGGYTVLTKYAHVKAAATDHASYASLDDVTLGDVGRPRATPAAEPSSYIDARDLGLRFVAPERLRQLEPQLRRLADEIVDEFSNRGACELVRDYAEQLPAAAISALMGVTGDELREMRLLSVSLSRSLLQPDGFQRAFSDYSERVAEHLEARECRPSDDFLTALTQWRVDAVPLSRAAQVNFVAGLLLAGHKSTASALSSLIAHVLGRPELRRKVLSRRRLLTDAGEEVLRLVSPFHYFMRTTVRATWIDDIPIPIGSRVMLSWAAANRDPDVFSEPERFRLDRRRMPHLAFGWGMHSCPGATLARMQLRVGIEQLMRKLPDIQLESSEIGYEFVGGLLAQPRELPATFSSRVQPT